MPCAANNTAKRTTRPFQGPTTYRTPIPYPPLTRRHRHAHMDTPHHHTLGAPPLPPRGHTLPLFVTGLALFGSEDLPQLLEALEALRLALARHQLCHRLPPLNAQLLGALLERRDKGQLLLLREERGGGDKGGVRVRVRYRVAGGRGMPGSRRGSLPAAPAECETTSWGGVSAG